MRDFTLNAYSLYLTSIKNSGIPFLRFDEFMSMPVKPEKFCLIRHDVDRKPQNALNMAELESSLGIKATYYFRTKPATFKKDIIKKIEALGHEIGYHYESLSDTNGNIVDAIADFEKNLKSLRAVSNINTCSMHGRPFKPYDNRDIWRIKENHDLLISKYQLLGEVYLDIDYSDIAYINDTGRNWTSGKSNVRDKVESNVKADFENREQLLTYLSSNPHPKMVFQIHPERWSDKPLEWSLQYSKDLLANVIKKILR